MSVNKVILVGRLGKDPELRYTQNGHAMAKFSLATDRVYKDREGTRVEDTTWHNIVVWGAQAETCEKYLSKGRQVYIEGRIDVYQYEDEKSGKTLYYTSVVATNVRFLADGMNNRPSRTNGATPPAGAEPPVYEDSDIPF